MNTVKTKPVKQLVRLDVEGVTLEGELVVPENAVGLVIFAHGSGSSRFSLRNNFVAQQLQRKGFATYLMDLLTWEEDSIPANRFNMDLLAKRLAEATRQLTMLPATHGLPLGYFGASTGAAAAISSAAALEIRIEAIVSRGGRPDLVPNDLYLIQAPTLLIVGSLDNEILTLNRKALEKIPGTKSLRIIEGATHLFEEPGALEQVAELSATWFQKYLTKVTA